MSLTPLDTEALRRSFNAAAGSYDRYAVLAREVGSRLLERVDFMHHEPATVLDLGCGTGTASRILARRFPRARVIALDWATGMLARVCHDTAAAEGVLPLCADLHALPIAGRSVDLLYSNLALAWSRDLRAVFHEIRFVMRPGAMLIFTCFGPDTLTELRQAWRAVDDLPHVNDYPDMHTIGDELMAAGFREPVMDAERLTLEYPDVMALLREIKWTGAHNVASKRALGLTGKTHWQGMLKAYEAFRRDAVYPASFEIIYGAAFAPGEGQPVRTDQGDIATFSVDALRAGKVFSNKV